MRSREWGVRGEGKPLDHTQNNNVLFLFFLFFLFFLLLFLFFLFFAHVDHYVPS